MYQFTQLMYNDFDQFSDHLFLHENSFLSRCDSQEDTWLIAMLTLYHRLIKRITSSESCAFICTNESAGISTMRCKCIYSFQASSSRFRVCKLVGL